jgi:hypothetical protein
MIGCTLLLSSYSTLGHAIEAYQASYEANIKTKVGFSGTLKRSLSKNAAGQWEFKDKISSLLASIDESSQLNISNNKVQPTNYNYLRKVLGKKKKRHIEFDWKNNTAVNRDQKSFALKPNTQNRLSYQLQLQLDLQQGKRGKFSYPVAKGDSIHTMKFVEVGTELVKTPMGQIKSIKLKLDRGKNAKRETYIWFSLKHNFVITQLRQTESDGKSYSIVLNKLS